MAQRVDVVIVGGGAMGAAAAWQLTSRGRSVALLEARERGHTWGSSHGSTRIFRVSYRDPRYTALATAALPLWRRAEAESGHVLLEQNGQLDHGIAVALDEIESSLRVAGWSAERLGAQAAMERWPGMVFESDVVYSPDGGRCLADRTVETLTALAEAAGAVTSFGTPARALEPAGEGVRVVTDTGAWEADVVVVSAGAWVTDVLTERWQGPAIPLPRITVTAQQPVHFAIRPGMSFPSYIHHVADDAPGAALRFGAYGLESPGEGVKVGIESTVREADLSTRTLEVSDDVTAEAARYADHWLPGADTSVASAVSCLFTETPDSHFIVDRRGPVVVCSPCSGHGFKFVPAIGAMVADLAMGATQTDPAWRLPA